MYLDIHFPVKSLLLKEVFLTAKCFCIKKLTMYIFCTMLAVSHTATYAGDSNSVERHQK